MFDTIRLSTEHIMYNLNQLVGMREALKFGNFSVTHQSLEPVTTFDVADFGVHRGADSLYYLRKGYTVMGVEGDIRSVEWLNEKFISAMRKNVFELKHEFISSEWQRNDRLLFCHMPNSEMSHVIDMDEQQKRFERNRAVRTSII